MTPLNTSSQPTKMVTAIPAISGIMMASRPATIIRTLRKIDHPRVFFTRVVAAVTVALMTVPPKFRQGSSETGAKQSAPSLALQNVISQGSISPRRVHPGSQQIRLNLDEEHAAGSGP